MKINITLPCYNEEAIIKQNILKLYNFSKENLNDTWFIVIFDNGSKDKTGEIGKTLRNSYPEIKYLYIPEKGKGEAIKKSWQTFLADIYIFFDADLAVKIDILPEMINILKEGRHQGVIGSRFLPDSRVKRSFFRKSISKIYNVFIRIIFGINIKDMACGAKVFNHEIIEKVLPKVQNNKWFFDSELVILALKQNYKIKEIPVIWQEFKQRKSKINFLKIFLEYLREIIKLKFRGY